MSHRIPVALMCVILFSATSAHAQNGAPQSGSFSAAQVTPYVFLGSNASSGVGAAVRWPLPASFSVELDTSYRRGGVAALTSSLNMLFHFSDIGRVTPYAAGGVGFDQYAYAERFGTGPMVANAATALAANAGGGVHIRASKRWGMRADARWSNGFGARAPERLRLYTGVTFGGDAR